MQENYEYPVDYEWPRSDLLKVIEFYHLIELANEGEKDIKSLKSAYTDFQEILGSKAQVKQYSRKFEEVSGYSIYETMKNI